MGIERVQGRCGMCLHFRNEPAYLEQMMPGLAIMSSGHASVRAEDGICAKHDRYLAAGSRCPDFTPRG